MAAKKLEVLEQESLVIDKVEYLVSAMPATVGLIFLEKYQEAIDSGKADLSQMKQIICKYVSKDNFAITAESFDVTFSRKYGHLQKLYKAVLEYNFADVFQVPDSEE